MARVFTPDDEDDDFLQHLLKSRVQRTPQLQRQTLQLVGGAPEEPPLPPPRPQALTGLIRSEKAMPAPSRGPPVPSLTPGAPTGSGDSRAAAINRVAQRIGADPLDLATVISFESAGTFSPSIYGGKGKRHLGLIQFGPNEQKKYGVHAGQTFDQQIEAAGQFLVDRGFKPGMSRTQLYSTILAGNPHRMNVSDTAAGGTPGGAAQKVATQMAGHEAKARKLLGGFSSPSAAAPLAVTAPGPQADAQPSSREGGRVRVADPNLISGGQGSDQLIGQGEPLPPPRPQASAFRTEQVAPAGPLAPLFKDQPKADLRYDPNATPAPPHTGPLAPLFKDQPNATLQSGQGGVTADPGSAASAGSGVTVATTPATQTQPATVTKLDPQTGGLRTYVLAGKDPGIVDRLNPQFSTGLQKLIESAPPEMRDAIRIRSAFRTPEEQAKLYATALQKYGSEAAARKFVAPPGMSRHGFGQAVDLDYGAPRGSPEYETRKNWVHQNAPNYGLQFPMGHEPWHVEPVGSRGGRDAGANLLPPEAGGPALGTPMPEPRVTEMPPAASAEPNMNVATPMSEADLAGGGGDTGLGGLLGGLAKGLGGGSSSGNLNVERTISPGMGQGYDEKLGAASKSALNAQPVFGNVGDLAKTRALQKMFDLQDLGTIGQPQLAARRKMGFGL